jgi:uncharacterized protein (DUF2267 family)
VSRSKDGVAPLHEARAAQLEARLHRLIRDYLRAMFDSGDERVASFDRLERHLERMKRHHERKGTFTA